MCRYHPDACQETLVVRAGIHSLRLVLPEKSKDEIKSARLVERIRSLDAKQPQNYQGRQQYVKELIDLSMDTRRVKGLRGGGATEKKIFKKHAARWNDMPESRKKEFEVSAGFARTKSRTLIAESIEATIAELKIVQNKIAGEQPEMKPLCLGISSLSTAQIASMDEALQSAVFRPCNVKALRDAARIAPAAATALVRLMSDIPVWSEASSRERPDWLSCVAAHRQVFARSAWCFKDIAGTLHFFEFLMALQSLGSFRVIF
jgi:hypothetical protein